MKKVWALTLPNIAHPELPEEDSFAWQDNCFCVADGITRDPNIPTDWTGWKTEEALLHYPSPSPAAEAARATVEEFINCAVKHSSSEALKFANRKVAAINEKINCDYLINDFAGCVAAGGRTVNNALDWASIGDSFVAVFSPEGEQTFCSPDGLTNFYGRSAQNPGNWRDPAQRVRVRRDFRNNPNNPDAYGALTGEKAAEHFIMSGRHQLHPGELVVFFTDGFLDSVKQPDFYEKILAGQDVFTRWSLNLAKADGKKFGRERTIIVVRIEG